MTLTFKLNGKRINNPENFSNTRTNEINFSIKMYCTNGVKDV